MNTLDDNTLCHIFKLCPNEITELSHMNPRFYKIIHDDLILKTIYDTQQTRNHLWSTYFWYEVAVNDCPIRLQYAINNDLDFIADTLLSLQWDEYLFAINYVRKYKTNIKVDMRLFM